MASKTERIGEFDPTFVAARAAIDQAKDFGRSAKEDLAQYQRWLTQYSDEQERDRQKHERRLERFEAEHRRHVRYRYARRRSRRHALAFAAVVRSVSVAIWSALVFAATRTAQFVVATATWISTKVYAATKFTSHQLARAATFIGAETANVARFSGIQIARAWAWLLPRAKHAMAVAARLIAKLSALIAALAFAASLRILDAGLAILSWLVVGGHDFARALPLWLAAGRRRVDRAASAGRDIGLRIWRSIPAVSFAAQSAPCCTSFILVEPSRCTALIPAETPRCTAMILYVSPAHRARLPAVVM